MLRKGYILFPKVLFEEQVKVTKGASGHFDAFILVLTHVNYSTTTCTIKNYQFECHRGESVMSIAHWAELFGWKRSRTRYFFQKMFESGIIEKLPCTCTTHIRIADYDLLMGQKNRPPHRDKVVFDTTFDAFWTKYHEVTLKPKRDIGRARREWNKLSAKERSLSMSKIDEYYDNLTNVKYCLQASSYLSNKAFLNEYNY